MLYQKCNLKLNGIYFDWRQSWTSHTDSLEPYVGDQRNSSATKSTGYSPIGSGFNSQQPMWWLTAICNSTCKGSNIFFWPL